MKKLSVLVFCLLSSVLCPLFASAQAPQLINYQGRLLNGTNLVNGNVGLSLRLFNVPSGGTSNYEDSNTVIVADGLYATFIGDDPVTNLFLTALTNNAVWVEAAVNGVTLSPRERLASVGYSLATRGILFTPENSLVVNPQTNQMQTSSYSTIGGGRNNSISSNNLQVFIGGGVLNSIGYQNHYAFIGGGDRNSLEGLDEYSVIGGGQNNRIQRNALGSTIAGGGGNTIGTNSWYCVIGGGGANTIGNNSYDAVIPGGQLNEVGDNASYAFAAGHQAKANHQGSFVWSDSQNADFASTTQNQFCVRAASGTYLTGGSTADALLTVESDISNSDEGDNPIIMLLQDGKAVSAFFRLEGLAGVAATGTLANALLVGSEDNDPAVQFVTSDSVRMTIVPGGNVGIGTTNPTGLLHVAGNAYATAWLTTSDRNVKQDIAPVDAAAILEKISALPVASWSFKTEPDVKHIGPMAQDFRAAFGLGPNDTSIATVDADGVALAAIQALNKKLDAVMKENTELRARLDALEKK